MKHKPFPKFAVGLVGAFMAFAHTSATAVEGATAPYNEAVTIVNGKRVVEVAPLPSHWVRQIHNFRKPVGADPILTHPADPILTRGWKPTARWSAVDKCRSMAGSLTSQVQRCSRGGRRAGRRP